MQKEALKSLYDRNHLPAEDYRFAETMVDDFQTYLDQNAPGTDVDDATEAMLDGFIEQMVSEGKNTIPAFVALLRYNRVAANNDLYVHLTRYIGGIDVIETILERLEKRFGSEVKQQVMEGLTIPKLGIHPRNIPAFTRAFVARLENELSPDMVEWVLAGNNHGVSEEGLRSEKIEYEQAATFADYLKGRHERKVAELRDHMEKGKVWFEQKITPEVLNFVESNPEILSGVIQNDVLYVTKIPYDTPRFLAAQNDPERNYHACHCAFAREAILSGEEGVPRIWCYCSGGYAKFPFEVVLGTKLQVKLLKSALSGDGMCRFAIPLHNIDYKK